MAGLEGDLAGGPDGDPAEWRQQADPGAGRRLVERQPLADGPRSARRGSTTPRTISSTKRTSTSTSTRAAATPALTIRSCAATPRSPPSARRAWPHFLDWCRSNQVRGFLGEYGVPDSDPRWWAVLDDFLKTLDAAGMSGAYWAAGEWWGPYALAVQPLNGFTVDRPQMAYLLAHLPPGAFTSVSAAGNAGSTFAPGVADVGIWRGPAARSAGRIDRQHGSGAGRRRS